ncbi:MAG: CrcB family protein [Thermomonas sp.]|uniref:CrcB family protein n=1 Tax=Thermomonas sp. TaxID=1971895 RepID=UPI001E169803|nr:CrcB family protein [Thermomonas sp.]MBZ0086801.1 CrcB family protein [Thermomonas sp.]
MLTAIWWKQLALVMCGGALGAGGRFWLGGWLLRHLGAGLPWGTLVANLSGSFAIGFLAVWLEGRGPAALYWRAFLIVGLLGGLTTWSSLMLELLLLERSGRSEALVGYLGTTLVLGLLLVWLGTWAAGLMRAPFPA